MFNIIEMTNTYKLENLPSYESTIYKETCDCGNIIECATQADRNPEYHTGVYIKCSKCGDYVGFGLPVN